MLAARCCLVVAALCVAMPAVAEDKEAARKAYAEGSKYYDLNQYADALEAFKRAYWNYEDPVFLYNIAQCHRLLNHKSEAISFYRSYLRKLPQAKNRVEVQRIITELEAAHAQDKALATAPPEGTINETKPPTPEPTAPPVGATPTAAPATQPNLVLAVTTTAPAPRHADKPVWKKPWLWGVVGGAVLVAAGVAIGVGLAVSAPKDPSPSISTVRVN